MPMYYKIYQSLLKNRISKCVLDKIDDLQGGGRENISCLHTSLIVRESISWNIECGRDVYVCMLDARKAFDSVWIKGLMFKLLELKIDPKFCRILYDMYEEFFGAVRIFDNISEWFKIDIVS